ncbi:MAG: hypothetical protein EPO68_09285 [Planctomycetota bacterium]|nr:MAG: hypothetical protein EPO68_09285 [Planctomycetota bacterium]
MSAARNDRTKLALGALACGALVLAVLLPVLGRPAPSSMEVALQRSAAARERANALLEAAPESQATPPEERDELRAPATEPGAATARRTLPVPALAEPGAIAFDGTLALDTLRIRVATAAGAPVHGIRVELDLGADGEQLPLVDSLARAWTDADGRARIELSADTPLPSTARVVADALAARPISARIEPHHVAGDVVELVAPALGSVEVLVEDAGGAPLRSLASVELAAVGGRRNSAPLADGRAVFEFVEVGCNLRGSVQRHGATAAVHFEGPGPIAASQRARLYVRLGTTNPMLVGALAGAFGGVPAELEFSASLVDDAAPENAVELGTTWTDDEGRFRIDLDAPLRARGALALRLLSVAAHDAAPYRARVALALPFDAGVRDVGVVRLEPLPLVAGGRAFGPRGPVHESLDFEFFARTTHPTGATVWEPLHFDHVAAKRYGGEFSIYGACELASLGVRVRASGAASEIVEVERGSTGGSVWLAPKR